MKMTVKIFLLPGLNKKTMTKQIELKPGADLRWLLGHIREEYGIDLLSYQNFIAILDGEAVDIDKDLDRNIESNREMWIIPQISGG